jgi:hypothetical protein
VLCIASWVFYGCFMASMLILALVFCILYPAAAPYDGLHSSFVRDVGTAFAPWWLLSSVHQCFSLSKPVMCWAILHVEIISHRFRAWVRKIKPSGSAAACQTNEAMHVSSFRWNSSFTIGQREDAAGCHIFIGSDCGIEESSNLTDDVHCVDVVSLRCRGSHNSFHQHASIDMLSFLT